MAYPELTLDGKGLFNPIQLIDLQYPTPRTLHNVDKYSERGFDFRVRPTAWAEDPLAMCDTGPACSRTVRYFGDKYCLMGSFLPHDDASHTSYLPSPSRTVRWWRGGPPCGGDCVHDMNGDERSLPHVQTCLLQDAIDH